MKRKFFLVVSFLLVGALFAFPTTARAIDSSSLASETILQDSYASPRRTPMPTTRTYLTSATARSTATGGFAYIYLKVNATIDAQYNTVMRINGAWVYQADASRAFDHWQTLSLNSNYSAHSIHAAATGYVYFVGDYGMKDKYYLTIDHTWVP